MKTILEILKEIDISRLISYYIYEYQLNYLDISMLRLGSSTYNEIIFKEKNGLKNGIMKMIETTPSDNPKTLVLYGMYGVASGQNRFDIYKEPAYSFCDIEEIKKDIEDAPDYSIDFSPMKDILGYYVADTDLTQTHLYEAIASCLHEAFIHGIFEKDRTKNIQNLIKKLDAGMKNMEDAVSLEELEKKLESDDDSQSYGKSSGKKDTYQFLLNESRKRRKKLYDEELEADERKLMESAYDFFRKYRAKERKKILDSLNK